MDITSNKELPKVFS